MWGRQGLPKTPFPITLGMVWTARDSQRHSFRIALSAPWCAPALQSHHKACPYGASLGAVWACLGVWLPYGTMAKKTHVEALWWFFGPAWVRRPSCYSHDKADPCGASLRPLWACLRVWACLAKAMASQAHVEPLWWLCWPATQTTRKQMSSPGTHQYTNTQGPVSLNKNIGAEGPVAQRSGNEERRSATPMSSPDTGGPNPSTGDSKKIFLLRSLAARLHSKVTREKMPLEVVGGPCPVRKLRKRSPGA